MQEGRPGEHCHTACVAGVVGNPGIAPCCKRDKMLLLHSKSGSGVIAARIEGLRTTICRVGNQGRKKSRQDELRPVLHGHTSNPKFVPVRKGTVVLAVLIPPRHQTGSAILSNPGCCHGGTKHVRRPFYILRLSRRRPNSGRHGLVEACAWWSCTMRSDQCMHKLRPRATGELGVLLWEAPSPMDPPISISNSMFHCPYLPCQPCYATQVGTM